VPSFSGAVGGGRGIGSDWVESHPGLVFDLLDQANALKREHQAGGGQKGRPDEDGQHEPPH